MVVSAEGKFGFLWAAYGLLTFSSNNGITSATRGLQATQALELQRL